MPRARPTADRFWEKVEKGDDCWLWTGSRNKAGYGSIHPTRSRKREGVHRLAWQLAHGPIPEGMFVLHHCDNPPCVKTEPDKTWPEGHLFLGTPLDNMHDMIAKGRQRKMTPPQQPSPEQRPRGERQGSAKLTVDAVREIRAAHSAGANLAELGRQFHVSPQSIHKVVNRRTWAHVS